MKISLVKTGVALLIGSSYMFVCGVTGTVGGEAMSQDIPASTAEAEGMEDDIGEAVRVRWTSWCRTKQAPGLLLWI